MDHPSVRHLLAVLLHVEVEPHVHRLGAKGGATLFAAALAAIEREMEPLLQMLSLAVGAPIDAGARGRAVASLAGRLQAAAPAVLPALEALLEKRLSVAVTLEEKLRVMPKAEFERVLRGIFEADEWILVSLGGFLGGVIGMAQAGVLLLFGG